MPPKGSGKKGTASKSKAKNQQHGSSSRPSGSGSTGNQTITAMFQRQHQRMGVCSSIDSIIDHSGDIEYIGKIPGSTDPDGTGQGNAGEASKPTLQSRRSRLSLKRKSSETGIQDVKRKVSLNNAADYSATSASGSLEKEDPYTSRSSSSLMSDLPESGPRQSFDIEDENSNIATPESPTPDTNRIPPSRASTSSVADLITTEEESPEVVKSLNKDKADCDVLSSPQTSACVSSSTDSKLSKDSQAAEDIAAPSTSTDNLLSSTSSKSEGSQDSQTLDEASNEEELYRIPYYLESFLLIKDTIMDDDFFHDLFNDEDRTTVKLFCGLSEEGQKLYVRLFGRKHRWLRPSKIVYPKIAEDLSSVLEELVDCEFLLNESGLVSLETTLHALAAPELKQLAKMARLPQGTGAASQKGGVIEALLKHSKTKHMGAFLLGGPTTTEGALLKRANALLGPAYYLNCGHREVFMRMLMLFGLNRTRGDDDETGTLQQQIFQMLMSNIGRIKYPKYTIFRESKVFHSRECLYKCSKALQTETDMSEALAHKEFDEARRIYVDAKPTIDKLMEDKDMIQRDSKLVEHLRCYTAGAAYTRVQSQAVELHQFTREYKQAVAQLEQLLEQRVYHPDYRGRWYERLALNLEYHLKQHSRALDIIQEALADDRVRTGHRYALFQRAQRLCQTSQKKALKARWEKFSVDSMCGVQEAPKVVIKALQLAHSIPGGGNLYIDPESDRSNADDVTLLKRVEDVSLAHYRQNGYPEGIHGEGGTFRCLFTLYFWDLLFMEGIPDIFYTSFQTCPLDLSTDHFYNSRRADIDDRLKTIREASEEELEALLKERWEEHQDTLCVGMNWQRFDSPDHAVGLVKCLSGQVLAGIFQRMMTKNMRHTTGGLPDLVVWNTDQGTCRIVEVKGPGDRLSTKQILWLDHLLKLGVAAEVCHVQAVGSKKIQS